MMIQRDFYPGSEWLYCKIFCGFKSAEKILANDILELVLENEEYYTKFFFIRYSEDFPHFRLRFYNENKDQLYIIQKKLFSKLYPHFESGVVHKVSLDTYKREISRYKNELITEVETIFYHDSLAVLKMIHLFGEIEDPEKYRMLMSLRGIDSLLSDFKLSIDEKHIFSKRIQQSFFREFGGSPNLQQQLNDKYRAQSKIIFSHMDSAKDEENAIEEAVCFYNIRSEFIRDTAIYIKERLTSIEELYDLLSSLIHMFMNRLFLSQNRKYELLIYHYLERYYGSQKAILQNKNKSGKNSSES